MQFYEFKEDENKIDIFNERFYRIQKDGEIFWLRNVNAILDIIDKGDGFKNYLKQSGFRADYMLAKAGEFGRIFHHLTELHDSQNEISYYYLREMLGEEIAIQLWERFVRYCEWIESLKNLEIIHIEQVVYSLEHQYAGTADRIVKYEDNFEIWDIKTSGDIYPSYYQQLAAYSVAAKESLGLNITKARILWFPDKKEKEEPDGKVTYHPNKNGYRIIEISEKELEFYFDLFIKTKALFDYYHKDKPKVLTLPIKIKWEK